MGLAGPGAMGWARRTVASTVLVLATAWAGGAWAQTRQENLCLTCPRPEPACWMALYRWQDYNLKGDFGTSVIVTAGQPPSEDEKERERRKIERALSPTTKVSVIRTSRIACPPGTRVE